MPQLTLGHTLFTGIVASLVAVGGWMMSAVVTNPAANMFISPNTGAVITGEQFTIEVKVSATVPVNVFKGEVIFNPNLLLVERIDYNTSIADLWAEEPWYSNGDGTLNFIGGTTRPGGFTGEDTLITVTFATRDSGNAAIGLSGARILRHDGHGTDIDLAQPVEAVFAVNDEEQLRNRTVLNKSELGPDVSVLPEAPTPDLNKDGKVSMADMSIFMQHLASGNLRSDFNQDGRVSTADMSILLNAF